MSNYNPTDYIRTIPERLVKSEKGSKLINSRQEMVQISELIPAAEERTSSEDVQGYYGLLSGFYFDGIATTTTIPIGDVNTWIDVDLTVNANGTFDNRPSSMKDAFPAGHYGGVNKDPIVFSLEGLDQKSFANFRASMSFVPEEDEGQLESRLLFNRHSGTTPSADFSIEEVSLSMQNGADIHYVTEPMLSFFVGDTIDTNGAGDAGKCRFQLKTNVPGVVHLRALTWYIQR